MKKWIAIVLIMVFIAGVTPALQNKAAESNYITTRNYIIRLVKAVKIKVEPL